MKPTTQDDSQRTDLQYAVHSDDASKVASLLERGADPSTVDDRGITVLQVALEKGNDVLATVLLAYLDSTTVSQILQDGLPLDQLLVKHAQTWNSTGIMKVLL